MNKNFSSLAVIGCAVAVFVVVASYTINSDKPVPRYAFCSINGNPTYAIPEAAWLTVDESAVMRAGDVQGNAYYLRLREGETCTLETAINVEGRSHD